MAAARSTDRGRRGTPATFHPHFLFGAPKRKRRWSRQKKKRPPGGHGPPGETALNCPAPKPCTPLREHGRGLPQTPAPPAPCRTLMLSGKTLHLTSGSFRTLRFAKRSPGIRGDLPVPPPVIPRRPNGPTRLGRWLWESVTLVPVLMVFAPIPTPPSPPLPQALRYAPATPGTCGSLPQPPEGRGDLTPPRLPSPAGP